MSTQAIREALEAVRWDGLSGKEKPSYIAALAEVEAIEKAAKVLDGVSIRHAWNGDAWSANGDEFAKLEASADTLASIAKCAK